MPTIDLNADMGEGFGPYRPANDAELLTLVTSASIACGFHAGDPVVMRETVAGAVRRGVAIGAHPGYPDLLGFGRRALAASADEVTAYVIYQVGALAAVCHAAGTRLRYVKPHGALYNRAVSDPPTAAAIANGIRMVDSSLVLLGLAASALIEAGRTAGLRTAAEAFIDRAYQPDGTLMPRDVAGAVLTDQTTVVGSAVRLALDGRADSLCVHGDTVGAPALLRAVRDALEARGVTIAPFAP
jgi:5-oxoprolinase (ATP-hydrolysing) subunit A